MEQGRSDLKKMQNLYSESLIMDWWYNTEKEGDKWAAKPPISLPPAFPNALRARLDTSSFWDALWCLFEKNLTVWHIRIFF